MIVSRKIEGAWINLVGSWSRLSGPCYENYYRVNSSWHRLYGRSYYNLDWDINNIAFKQFKEVAHDSF